MSMPLVHIVGGGLAGCEAALQLARLGIRCLLHEAKPQVRPAAHRSDDLAEIVCSNSLKSTALTTPSGLLKAELDMLGCRLLAVARESAVPAGSALAVDRERFSRRVAERLAAEPAIRIKREEIRRLPHQAGEPWIVAAGPLCSEPLQRELAELAGEQGLHFFDAIAPSVTRESLAQEALFRADRYDRGGADHLNIALDRQQYRQFVDDLLAAEKMPVADFDRSALFGGCQPLEEIAATGPQSLAFGPLRPVGLHDPRTGRRPHAVVQLRQENREGTLYGLVGFQTRLRHGEQLRVFRSLPGLAAAEFVRLGQMHRNFYVDTPRVLDRGFALRRAPWIRLAGQITGVEGYVESIASGLVTAWRLAADLRGIGLPPWPRQGMIGSLIEGFLFDGTGGPLSPMNANFGLLPPPAETIRDKRERALARSRQALAALDRWYREGAAALVGDPAGAAAGPEGA